MKVEIWSDVMCPFCYIGKRHFEKALEGFPNRDKIEVVWKSFQLNPAMKTEPGKNINQYLAEHKGWSMEQARQANEHVTRMAKEAGLEYDMERAVVANSFDAHRLVQLAKKMGKGDAMEERLFQAYFAEGKNIAEHITLVNLAADAGLDKEEAEKILADGDFKEEVERDIYEAKQINLRGVPYFVLNDRYAISGAQPIETFVGALRAAWIEWEQQNPPLTKLSSNNGGACSVDGNC